MRINDEYIKQVLTGNYIEDYKDTVEKVKNSSAIYKGKPVPFLFNPMFFTKKDIDNFKKIAKIIMSIGNKVIDEYLKNKAYRQKFGFSPLLEELILLDHGYKVNVPIGRFDIFYDGYDFKFCELNTDGSSAMNEDNTIARILLESKSLIDFKKNYDINYLECIDKWVEECLKIYQEYDNTKKKPTIAIVDFLENATTYEFIEFKKAFERKGYRTYICDIKDLHFKNGKLYYKDKSIDLIYRRAVTKEIIDRIDEVTDFIEAYKAQKVCVVGPFKSQILHNKIIFKILHDEDTLRLCTDDEKRFIKNHIPYTNLFSGSKEIFDEVLINKNKYILKPLDLYASRGVYAGLDYDIQSWKDKLLQCFNNGYLYQEYFTPFTRDFIVYDNNTFKISSFKYLIGLFIYNEKFSGLYTRIGKKSIISGLHGYYTVPNMIVKKKKV